MRKSKRRTPNRTPGRPRAIGLDSARNHHIRCSEEQWARWQRVAGPGKLSAWIRTTLDRAAARQLAPKHGDRIQRELEF